MKKIYGILMLAMLAMCSVAFVSCGDDDDEENGSIVGTWREVGSDEDDYWEFTFKSDGTYEEDDDGHYDKGTYKLDGNTLTVIGEKYGTSQYTYKVSGKKLTLTWEEPVDRGGVVVINSYFERK